MRRFFFNQIHKDNMVWLNREESHHLTKVLRLRVGEEVELLDGQGALFSARIESLGKEVKLHLIEQKIAELFEDKVQIWVFQGNLKGKKMDLVVQKCTELGVDRFVSFSSSRSQGRSSGDRVKRKNERWQKLIESACKQSRRLVLMTTEELTFSEILKSEQFGDADLKVIFWEEEHDFMLSDIGWNQSYEKICLMLGPEGGISVDEIQAAKKSGWKSVSLGKHILRAETATIAAVSIVQNRLGNI